MDDTLMEESPWFQAMPKELRETFIRSITTKEVPWNPTPQAAEIPKSPKMLRTKKDPQIPGLVRRLSQNPRFSKLTMEEKGKVVTIESDEEEEGPLTYVEEIDPDGEGKENIQLVRRPKYVPPSKGKAKVPKNLDDVGNILISPSLPKWFPLEGMVIGRISMMKFEDWDLACYI